MPFSILLSDYVWHNDPEIPYILLYTIIRICVGKCIHYIVHTTSIDCERKMFVKKIRKDREKSHCGGFWRTTMTTKKTDNAHILPSQRCRMIYTQSTFSNWFLLFHHNSLAPFQSKYRVSSEEVLMVKL